MTKEYLWPKLVDGAAQTAGLPGGVCVGGMIFLSGQIALNGAGEFVGAGDCFAQATQCFSNVVELLDRAGVETQQVVKLTCYLTNPSHYTAYAEVRKKWFPGILPAGTCVIVQGLLLPDALIEIDVVASTSTS
jgi:2-iminobutanoate/2-iminopropanoate deaminase